MQKLIIKFLIISSVIFFSSCASIVNRNVFFFDTDIESEDVIIEITNKKTDELVYYNTLPTEIRLGRGGGEWFQKADYEIKIYREGAAPLVYRLISDGYDYGDYIIGNSFLNLGTFLVGGTVGFLIVDPLFGSMFEWQPLFKQEGNGEIIAMQKEDDKRQYKRFKVVYDEASVVNLIGPRKESDI